MGEEFETWFKANENYYKVKFGGDEAKMRDEAQEAYKKMKGFTGEPSRSDKKK